MDIGIDLGTTYSVIAVDGKVELVEDYPEGIYFEECDVTIIPTPYGEETFPSVLIQNPDNPDENLFGSDAFQRAEEGFAPVMFSKRKIGTKEEIPMQTRAIIAKDVACEFLRYLKCCAEQALGQTVSRAVVTHPAYFDRGAVEETREAAQEAGFDMSLPDQMLMEPVAAALSYAHSDKRDPLRILTYDMGGGTFDVTFLERREGVIDMRAFDGDPLLGGYNFDRELVHWIRERLKERGRNIELNEDVPEDRGRLARLLRLAEQTKIKLANARIDSAKIDVRARDILIDNEGRPVQINERISRKEFVKLIQTHLGQAVSCCHNALQKADMQPEDVDELLLVGGSTYGPWIAESLTEAFPNLSPKLFSPDLCVGAGAAIYAKMALPSLVGSAQYRLSLDVPEYSVLDLFNIAGQVTKSDRDQLNETFQAVLKGPDGSVLETTHLDKSGRFFFGNVELMDDDPNQFILIIADSDGVSVLDHKFVVVYAPEAAETSGVTTVLPRPLFIETVNGFVALAEEGVALPAKCARSFRRVNDNPNITLKLFQEKDSIGEMLIEDIPLEGGRGSIVDFEVEVTEKNQIRGIAVVRSAGGKTIMQTDVRVQFEMPEIAPESELRSKFNELKRRLLGLILIDDAQREEVEGEGIKLVEKVEHLFKQQPLERQEIHVALRSLNTLLNPPADDMMPTRQEFIALVRECRTLLKIIEEKAGQVIERSNFDKDDDMTKKLADNARTTLKNKKYYRNKLDVIEQKGMTAHDKKDRRMWARIHDDLTDLVVKLRDKPGGVLPTFINKLLASAEVLQHMEQVDRIFKNISERGDIDNWKDEIERIQKGLKTALTRIQDVGDDLPDDQGLGQIRLVLDRVIGPLKTEITDLGWDVRKL